MRKLTVYETKDRARHDSEKAARQHADEMYGRAVATLAHRAAVIDKYTTMVEFFENAETCRLMRALLAWKDERDAAVADDTEEGDR